MRRAIAIVTAAVVAAGLAAVVPAGAAHAASGAGWAASWHYYTANAYTFTGKMPGVEVIGFASDHGGHRFAVASLVDTAVDGKCASVTMFGTRDGSATTIADHTVCDGEPFVSFSTGNFTESHQSLIGLTRSRFGPIEREFGLFVPGSGDDPALRSTTTRVSWEYVGADEFTFSGARLGFRVAGNGRWSPNVSISGFIVHDGAPGTCVTATVLTLGPAQNARACNPGDFGRFGSEDAFLAFVDACHEAASIRCFTLGAPQPQ